MQSKSYQKTTKLCGQQPHLNSNIVVDKVQGHYVKTYCSVKEIYVWNMKAQSLMVHKF